MACRTAEIDSPTSCWLLDLLSSQLCIISAITCSLLTTSCSLNIFSNSLEFRSNLPIAASWSSFSWLFYINQQSWTVVRVIWLQTGKVLSASTWLLTNALCSEPCKEGFEDCRWTSYWPRGPQLTSLNYENTTGFRLSPLSRGRWYNCTSYHSMQCLNASLERNTWWFYSSIGYAKWYPLASSPEVFQSFKEVLSTLRSVGDVHCVCAVASALGVCLVQASTPKVR